METRSAQNLGEFLNRGFYKAFVFLSVWRLFSVLQPSQPDIQPSVSYCVTKQVKRHQLRHISTSQFLIVHPQMQAPDLSLAASQTRYPTMVQVTMSFLRHLRFLLRLVYVTLKFLPPVADSRVALRNRETDPEFLIRNVSYR